MGGSEIRYVPSTAAALLRYPVGGQEAERPLVASWICILVSFLLPVVPLVPVVGYLVAVIDASDRDESAPAFLLEPWTILRRGIGGTLLAVVFLAGPFVALAITVYGATYGTRTVDPGTTPTLVVYAGSTVVLTFALVGAYLLPIALFRYGRTGSLKAAFSRTWHRGAATHGAYFAGWTLGAVILFLGIALGVGLFSIDPVGPILAALAVAHASILAAHVWGRALARVH